jgi:hypothetical protein
MEDGDQFCEMRGPVVGYEQRENVTHIEFVDPNAYLLYYDPREQNSKNMS